ncbi:MAG: Extracellular Matrix protein PelB, partial [Labilithrix sp.]|nr:Extracellular Matrix protein PelB [Labilithrix sp.]
ASHDELGGRLTYFANGSRMTDRSGQLLLPTGRYEAEAGATLRLSSLRSVTELSASADYQTDAPVARGGFFDQRQVARGLGITTEVRGGSRIVDTSFLRVAAVRNLASLGVRYDLARWYASAEIEGREEQTRSYQHLAWDVLAGAEAGFKVLTREPHVSIGVQAQASQREYARRLPDEVTKLVSPNVSLARALPPSFQLVGAVVHLSRGDVSERFRPDRAAFPRYDCEAAFGALLPDTDTALHLLCGASFRIPGGYTTLLAFYNRGVAGVRNNENAELALSYTLPF